MFKRFFVAQFLSIILFVNLYAQHGGARYPGLAPGPDPVSLSSQDSRDLLIPFSKNGDWGFMKASGEVVVPAVYPKVGNYHEGLSAVRFENGKYGYIDETGAVVLPAHFDKASAFRGGIAVAFLDTIPCLISRNGRTVSLEEYAEVFNAGIPNRWIVRTLSKQFGIVNGDGRLILDTLYSDIEPFGNGLSVVSQKVDNPDQKNDRGVVDMDGRVVIPFGKYQIYGNYENEVALVIDTSTTEMRKYGLIDKQGKLIFTEVKKDYTLHYGRMTVYDGHTLIVDFPSSTQNSDSESSGDEIIGAVNLAGEVLFKDPEIERITAFGKDRAFAETEDGWNLINRNGEVLSGRPYQMIYNYSYSQDDDYFGNGFELVNTQEGWCAIDRNGKVVAGPLYRDLENIVQVEKLAVLYAKDDGEDERTLIGIWDIESDRVIEPQYDDIEWLSPNQDIFKVRKDDKELVLDITGEIIYEQEIENTIGKLNIDFMNRGYFYAASPPKKKYSGYGGWGGSGNLFKELPEKERDAFDKLEIRVEELADTVFAGNYRGHSVRLINGSKDTVVLSAQDSRLYMKVQAKNEAGEWKDIEYLPSSWCGNSYHQVYLPKDRYWEFVTPAYGGGMKTELRVQLEIKEDDKEPRMIYSNVYQGAINPGQFWNKPDYYSQGLMDPYND